MRSAKDAPFLVAIDGCQAGCTRALLAHLEIVPRAYVVLTEEQIEKIHELRPRRDEIDRAKAAVKRAAQQGEAPVLQAKPLSVSGRCGCGTC